MFTYNKYCDASMLSGKEELGILNVVKTKTLRADDKRQLKFLLKNKDSIVLHLLCSGYGGSVFEPGAPSAGEMLEAVNALADGGFPPLQIVLSITPLFQNTKGLQAMEKILGIFYGTGIIRVRLNPIVIDGVLKGRFLEKFGKVPIIAGSFSQVAGGLDKIVKGYPGYDFESYGRKGVPVVSRKDLNTLGIRTSGIFAGDNGTLPHRIIGGRGGGVCGAGCVYCREGCFDCTEYNNNN